MSSSATSAAAERTHADATRARASTRSVLDATLTIFDGPHQGTKVSLQRERLHVGRADWCDVVLDRDPLVSRHHCELLTHQEGLVVRDHQSRNGIYIDDIQVYHGLLVPGRVLRVGSSSCSLEEHGAMTLIEVPFHDPTGHLVGSSERMRELFSLLAHLAPGEIPVLLQGETGTGKTSFAEAIHKQSPRKDGPFVHVNCGTFSASLIESSLFGYEKGAFTGAQHPHKGVFEQAKGGTLFLDEIGELPLELQPKLLDVLERKKVRRLGAEREIDVDFRFVCATHRDLQYELREGRFRADLFYRIAVAELMLPPLRERWEDIPLLVEAIGQELGHEAPVEFAPGVLEQLQRYLWPGNVRQLRNALERAFLFARGGVLSPHHIKLPALPEELPPLSALAPSAAGAARAVADSTDGQGLPLTERVSTFEKQLLEQALTRFHWNAKKVRSELGISKSWYYTLLKKHGLERPEDL